MENCTVHVLPKTASFKPEAYSSYIGRDLILLFRNEYAVLLRKANLELLHRFREEFTVIDLTNMVKQVVSKQAPIPLNTFVWLAEGETERYIGLDVVIANQEGASVLLKNATSKELFQYKTEHSIYIDFSDHTDGILVKQSPAVVPCLVPPHQLERIHAYTGRDVMVVPPMSAAILLRKAKQADLRQLLDSKSLLLDLTDALDAVIDRSAPVPLKVAATLTRDEIGRYAGRNLILVNETGQPVLLKKAKQERILQHWNQHTIVIDLTDSIEEFL